MKNKNQHSLESLMGNAFFKLNAIYSHVSQTLLNYILENLEKISDVPSAIKQAFKQLDEEILNYQCLKGTKGGTTVLCLLFLDCKLYLCNLGDSIAVKLCDNEIEQLNTEHKLNNTEEYEKIIAKGGIVIENKKTLRIDGELSISRALGDLNYKNSLISEPEIKIYDLESFKANYLLLGTDGFWNIISKNEVLKSVNQLTSNQTKQEQFLTSSLVNKALKLADNKKNDNITLLTLNLSRLKQMLQTKPEQFNVKTLNWKSYQQIDLIRKDDSTGENVQKRNNNENLPNQITQNASIFTFDQDL